MAMNAITFARSNGLARYTRMYMRDKAYKCQQCPRKFSSWSCLNKQVLTHGVMYLGCLD